MAHLIIDIGHANGTGARGNNREEHADCAVIARHIRDRLKNHGHKITLLDFPTLSNREDINRTVKAANAAKGVLFGVSLHMDASSNAKAKGAHVCKTSPKGKLIAECIAAPLVKLMPGRAESVKERDDLAMLNQTVAPWVLVELGFITNKDDVKKLHDNPNTAENELKPLLDALEKGILDGIERAREWTTKNA